MSFPGAEDVALTGPRYKVRLIQPETLARVARGSAGLRPLRELFELFGRRRNESSYCRTCLEH